MKSLGRNLVELTKNSPSEALTKKVADFIKGLQESEDSSIQLDEDFSLVFGGQFYLVESEADLEEIPSAIYSKELDRYFNMKEYPSEYDIFEKLDDNYYQVLLCTNNSGGNTYIIPASIVQNNKNALASLNLTVDNYWESNL